MKNSGRFPDTAPKRKARTPEQDIAMPDITVQNTTPPLADNCPAPENPGKGSRSPDADDIRQFTNLLGEYGTPAEGQRPAAFASANSTGAEALHDSAMNPDPIKSFTGSIPFEEGSCGAGKMVPGTGNDLAGARTGEAEAFARQDPALPKPDSLFSAKAGSQPGDAARKASADNDSTSDTAALRDLFSGMMRQAESLVAGRSEQTTASASANAAEQPQLEQLVERILVSAPDQNGQEVRITLSSQTLQGTDIILHRGVGGELTVILQTSDPAAFQTLVSSQGDLKQLLEAQEKGEVRVTVAGDTQQEQNDSNRRSRGYSSYENDDQSARG